MVVMLLERVTPSLRGHLSRWLLEVKTGVFVGHVSGLVRDKLWELMTKNRKEGSVVQIWSTNTPQGFAIRNEGDRDRVIVDFEGLQLEKRLVSR